MAPTTQRTVRHFYRCCDCLAVVATDAKIQQAWTAQRGYHLDAQCGACEGRIEYMGETTRHGLRRHVGEVPPCDGKCTGARGPSCDCQCGGEHHGSGVTVPVYEYEGIPRLAVPPDAKVKAETYRALCEQFRSAWDAKYNAVTERKRYEYLGGGLFGLYLEGQHLWSRYLKAKGGRTHGSRNKNIQALIAECSGSPEISCSVA